MQDSNSSYKRNPLYLLGQVDYMIDSSDSDLATIASFKNAFIRMLGLLELAASDMKAAIAAECEPSYEVAEEIRAFLRGAGPTTPPAGANHG